MREIEIDENLFVITPEMITAGTAVIDRSLAGDDLVIAIYSAMSKALPRPLFADYGANERIVLSCDGVKVTKLPPPEPAPDTSGWKYSG